MSDLSVHYSSATDQWATPQALFDALHASYAFDLDVCADASNAKCARYFTEAQDGLRQKWDGRCWMNPPYGREIGRWVFRAYMAAVSAEVKLVCCLLPARTDTRWWFDYCIQGHIVFLKGRLKFGDAKNGAPFPSAIVTFHAGLPQDKRIVEWWDRNG